ncbi:hypothetical protein [Winogradskyella sp.]|uniref:hypothetical protein n=1 Tax=Winogradskyella sp. TaxID=1883156 RepID=UPI003BAA646C
MMNTKYIFSLLFFCCLVFSCSEDDGGVPTPSQGFISGEMNGVSVTYEQNVFDGGPNNDINVYNRTDQTLLLQANVDGIPSDDGIITLRMNGVDLDNLSLPYSLTGVEGSLTWVDASIKALQPQCEAPDVLCFYSGVGVDEVEISITDISNNTISGSFTGSLYHIQVNPSVIRDTQDVIDVVRGTFEMKFVTIDL